MNKLMKTILVMCIAVSTASCGIFSSGSLEGQVEDTAGSRLTEVTVTIDGETVTSNEYGFYSFEKIDTGSHVLTASKEGYAPQHIKLHIKKDAVSRHTIRLLRYRIILVKSFQKDAKLKSGRTTITIPGGTIVNEDGDVPEKGIIRIAAPNVASREIAAMPGNFTGITPDGTLQNIESLGAFIISAESNGEKLHIKKDHTITVSLPVQNRKRLSSAPVWQFDRKQGVWKETGKVKITKGKAAIEINSLEWWNIDVPFGVSTVWIQSFEDSEGHPLSVPAVAATGISYYGRTAPEKLTDRPGVCINVKRGARFNIEALHHDEGAFYGISKTFRAKNVFSSCSADPSKGLVIKKLVLKKRKLTCLEVTPDLEEFNKIKNKRLAVTTAADAVVIYNKRIQGNKVYRIQNIPEETGICLFILDSPGKKKIIEERLDIIAETRLYFPSWKAISPCGYSTYNFIHNQKYRSIYIQCINRNIAKKKKAKINGICQKAPSFSKNVYLYAKKIAPGRYKHEYKNSNTGETEKGITRRLPNGYYE